MNVSHASEFKYLVSCLKAGQLPFLDDQIRFFEPSIVGNREQLLHGVVRAACSIFEDERLFDFELMPNKDITRLSTHLRTTEITEMHPPFQDWRFCFAATSDFKDSMEGARTFATSFYIVERPFDDAVLVSEIVLSAEGASFFFSGSVLIQLPITSQSVATVVACADGLQNELRLLIDSVLDPTCAALVMLNTKGVAYAEKRPPRAERRRADRDGQVAPSHWQVGASEYFTALRQVTGSEASGGGGGHASPIPHIRRGHWRNLASGQRTWVRDCLVNVSSQDQGAFVERERKRTAYKAGSLVSD
ncbi:hypothetical protein [uncultured Tateyamaria sp.]|uniref:hypothetical protein n=1 Tax=uncultured Tateyamaria sp. TaxID=455651 RepID=UPI002631A9E2|nr:hypothetical protein [uncultured Tateyamaria sp.]